MFQGQNAEMDFEIMEVKANDPEATSSETKDCSGMESNFKINQQVSHCSKVAD